jgi:VWFA-related protein
MECAPGFRTAVAAATMCGATLVCAQQQQPRYVERVDVARVIIDARVLDGRDEPMVGLDADDFRVKIDGKRVRIETATWIGELPRRADAVSGVPATPVNPAVEAEAAGRLVVFLFQKDLEPSRIVGLMQLLIKSRDFLATLGPRDRVAILSFDSHLKIWTDFTADRERLEHVLAHDVLMADPHAVQQSAPPSLLDRLTPARGKQTYGIERALELIGRALEPLPGSKSLVLVGHGFGRLGHTGVSMEHDYDSARQALVGSRTSVFSLDVVDADYHSLEVGLQLVAEETGGFYERTRTFPDVVLRRLAGALAGYYVLFVEKPDSPRATHDVDVELTRRKGRVYATSSYAAGPG